jgi:acid phosphatase family membrane protein YuiD
LPGAHVVHRDDVEPIVVASVSDVLVRGESFAVRREAGVPAAVVERAVAIVVERPPERVPCLG